MGALTNAAKLSALSSETGDQLQPTRSMYRSEASATKQGACWGSAEAAADCCTLDRSRCWICRCSCLRSVITHAHLRLAQQAARGAAEDRRGGVGVEGGGSEGRLLSGRGSALVGAHDNRAHTAGSSHHARAAADGHAGLARGEGHGAAAAMCVRGRLGRACGECVVEQLTQRNRMQEPQTRGSLEEALNPSWRSMQARAVILHALIKYRIPHRYIGCSPLASGLEHGLLRC